MTTHRVPAGYGALHAHARPPPSGPASASLDDFVRILNAGSFDDDDIANIRDYIVLWSGAADVAADLDPPAGVTDLHDLYIDHTDAFVTLEETFNALGQTDPDSSDFDEAAAEFNDALDETIDLDDEFGGLLDDAEAETADRRLVA